MSGGSYNYLYLRELDVHAELVKEMADRLKELGCRVAAERTQAIVTKFAEIVALQRELESVWHAVEWLDSGDWSKESAIEVVKEWEASQVPK